ncbi:MAG: hypothetical protein HOA19_03460 [Candidatus Marinimicrobia bacterium]|nr:hypothetical protein [Candidatus Neomarinimicrobiota bacterium]MBT6414037.1 hypothetical protein [Candidatus Neomarinimicrobiota bacterium]MBT6866389.1 hypothetical protein [Candidatus Neomarinimicrobiota bacterium]MBT7043302.1 hypothetical protein [Candidatus Neomarinimicrobiota bacterium]MBT7946248.1 hypothetical protein [Candidatus Neomarinimicrobiota bacterium]
MMKHTRYILTTVGLVICLVFFPNCRGKIVTTEDELAEYGWTMYESKDYIEARSWFADGIKKDTSYYDNYNGMGWTMGHLRLADSSVYYFEKLLTIDTTFDEILDIYAGLSFAHNALGNNTEARTYSNIFFGKQNPILDPDWVFDHNSKINYLDVRLILAVSEFRLALFENCQESINKIYKDSGAATVVEVDYTTPAGRSKLATHLASLQKTLQNT